MHLRRNIKIESAVKAVSWAIGITGVLAAAEYVSWTYLALFAFLMALSALLDYRERHFSRWVYNSISIAVIALSVYRISMTDIVVPALEALMTLMAVKFMERKLFRDYMQIYVIALFLLSGTALMSIGPAFLAWFFLLFFLISAAAVLLAHHTETLAGPPGFFMPAGDILKIAARALLIPIAAVPLMVVVFFALPRTGYQFLGFLNAKSGARSGFSSGVVLGDSSAIREDESVVLRAVMRKIQSEALYWRGVTLDTFDGRAWKRSPQSGPEKTPPLPPPKIALVEQLLYVEPYGENFLFALDRPVRVSMQNSAGQNAAAGRDSVFVLTGPSASIDRKIRYRAVSVLSGITAEKNIDRRRYLQLPQDIPEGILKLANDVTRGMDGGAAAKALTAHLKGGRYAYSLTGLPGPAAPLDDFLFKTRRGNCEYFASALAVMLRMRGIPSRLVGGYRGGIYNDNGGYYIVPQKNAHVWVEAYIEPGGWVRYDPTAAQPPETDARGSGRGFLYRAGHRAGMIADSFYFYWMEFVVSYDLERQMRLADKLRVNLDVRNLSRIAGLLVEWKDPILRTIIPGALMFAAFAAYRRLRRGKCAEMRLLERFLRRLLRLGCVRRPSQGLTEFALEIKDEALKTNALLFAREFERLYYKDIPFGKKDLKRLKKLIVLLS
jgi:transglutaminase-like putative cysteine protease